MTNLILITRDVAEKYGIADFSIDKFNLRVKVKKSNLYKLSKSGKTYNFMKPMEKKQFYLMPKNNTLPKVKIKGGDFNRLIKLGMTEV
jgi:YHS domain-containing protein